MPYSYEYPRPALTVDAVVFKETAKGYAVLLIERRNEPFRGKWALPGGFMDMTETLEEAVTRELQEETGLRLSHLKQLHAFSALKRDPRGRTVSVVFWGITEEDQQIKAGDDARAVGWYYMDDLPHLAFDHKEIIQMAIGKLQDK